MRGYGQWAAVFTIGHVELTTGFYDCEYNFGISEKLAKTNLCS